MSSKCECCGSYVSSRDTAHGVKFGTVDGATGLFLPARDSAWVVVCSACGESIYRFVYSKLKQAA